MKKQKSTKVIAGSLAVSFLMLFSFENQTQVLADPIKNVGVKKVQNKRAPVKAAGKPVQQLKKSSQQPVKKSEAKVSVPKNTEQIKSTVKLAPQPKKIQESTKKTEISKEPIKKTVVPKESEAEKKKEQELIAHREKEQKERKPLWLKQQQEKKFSEKLTKAQQLISEIEKKKEILEKSIRQKNANTLWMSWKKKASGLVGSMNEQLKCLCLAQKKLSKNENANLYLIVRRLEKEQFSIFFDELIQEEKKINQKIEVQRQREKAEREKLAAQAREEMPLLNQHSLPVCQEVLDESMKNGGLVVPEGVSIQTVQDRPNERWVDNQQGECLFESLPSPNDVVQGYLGDCGLCAVVEAALVKNPYFFINSITKTPDGNYIVKIDGEYFQITSKIPESIRGNSKLWFLIYEKAFVVYSAKHGALNKKWRAVTLSKISSHDYCFVEGLLSTNIGKTIFRGPAGFSVYRSDFKEDVIGRDGKLLQPSRYSYGTIREHSRLLQLFDQNYIFVFNAGVVKGEGIVSSENIYRDHAYGVLEVLPSQETSNGEILLLIKFRNPHGCNIPHYVQENGKWVLRKCPTSENGVFVLDMNQVISIFDYCNFIKVS